MAKKRYYMTFIILNILITGFFQNLINSHVISDALLINKLTFIFFYIHSLLLVFTFFYLIKRPIEEASSVACVIGLFELYTLLTDSIAIFFGVNYPYFLVYSENIIFLMMIVYQANKNYILESDAISKSTVCLIFYKPQTFKQYINAIFGLSFASVGVIIGNKKYNLEYGKSTIQEHKVYRNIVKKHYLVVDTGVPISKVSDVIPELLQQKARQPQTLYLRYNCLRSLKPVLNKLGRKWEYKGDVFPSIYLKRVLNDGRT